MNQEKMFLPGVLSISEGQGFTNYVKSIKAFNTISTGSLFQKRLRATDKKGNLLAGSTVSPHDTEIHL